MFSAALVALVCFAVGLLPALFLRRTHTAWTIITDSLLWSSLICSAIFWIPWLHVVRFDSWVWGLITVASLGIAASLIRSRHVLWRFWLRSYRTPSAAGFTAATVAAIVLYAVIGLVRANGDWDGLNYYLFSALSFQSINHVSATLPNTVVLGKHIPMVIPPLLPILYSIAVSIASISHGTADNAIRFVPFLFLVGTCSATMRLSRRLSTSIDPLIPAIMLLTLPVMIYYMVAQALSVDIALTFFMVVLLVESIEFDGTFGSAARIGTCISLSVLCKVTGPLMICFILAPIVLLFARRRIAQTTSLAIAVMFVATSLALHLVNPDIARLWWPVVIVLSVALVLATPDANVMTIRRPSLSAVLVMAAFSVPAVAYVIQITAVTGSPTSFYLPSLAHIDAPNWQWAFNAIRRANIYDSHTPPGLPGNYGIALVLWWGLGPLLNIAAIAGSYLVIRSKSTFAVVLYPAIMFDLAYMTIFEMGDLRRLLPTAPLIAILASYFLMRCFSKHASLVGPAMLLFAPLVLPFAWTAQMLFFNGPDQYLTSISLDQWSALSPPAILRSAILCVAGSVLFAVVVMHQSSVAALIKLLRKLPVRVFCLAGAIGFAAASILTVLIPTFYGTSIALIIVACTFATLYWFAPHCSQSIVKVGLVVLSIIPIGALFMPLLYTSIVPGYSSWKDQVERHEYYGYVPAIRSIAANQNGGSILTFLHYGITWFTLAHFRHVEIADAFDLSLLKNELQHRDPTKLLEALRRIGATTAILPAPDSYVRVLYQSLENAAGLKGLDALDDPLLGRGERSGDWNAVRFFKTSSRVLRQPPLMGINARGTKVQLDGALLKKGTRLNAFDFSSIYFTTAPMINVTFVTYPNRAAYDRNDGVPVDDRVRLNSRGSQRLYWISRLLNVRKHGKVVKKKTFAVKIFSISLTASAAEQIAAGRNIAWRSQDLVLFPTPTAFTTANTSHVFTQPELSSVDVVELTSKQHEYGGLRVYPGDVVQMGSVKLKDSSLPHGSPVLRVGLRESDMCPAGRKISLLLKGRITGANNSHPRIAFLRTSGHAGDDARFDLSKAFRTPQDVALQIERISSRGQDKSCAISSTVESSHLRIVRNSDEAIFWIAGKATPFELTGLSAARR